MLNKVSLLIRHKVDLPLWIRRMSWQSSGDVYQHPGQTPSALLSVTWSSLTCNRFQDKGTETPTHSCHPEHSIRQSAVVMVIVIVVPTPTTGDTQPISKPGTFCLLQIFPKLSHNIFYFFLKKKCKTHISFLLALVLALKPPTLEVLFPKWVQASTSPFRGFV